MPDIRFRISDKTAVIRTVFQHIAVRYPTSDIRHPPRAVCFLWHFPLPRRYSGAGGRYPPPLPCGARTFLPGIPFAQVPQLFSAPVNRRCAAIAWRLERGYAAATIRLPRFSKTSLHKHYTTSRLPPPPFGGIFYFLSYVSPRLTPKTCKTKVKKQPPGTGPYGKAAPFGPFSFLSTDFTDYADSII